MITLRLEPRNSFVGWNHMAFTNQASEKWVTNKNFRKFKFVVWKMSNLVFQIFWGLCIKWFLRILRPRSLAEPSPSVSIWLATLSTVFATGRLNNNRYILKKFTLVPNDIFFFFKSLLDCYPRICLSCTKSIRMLIAQIDRFQWLWRLWTGDGEHVWLFSRACVILVASTTTGPRAVLLCDPPTVWTSTRTTHTRPFFVGNFYISFEL